LKCQKDLFKSFIEKKDIISKKALVSEMLILTFLFDLFNLVLLNVT